jgi:hypothetical protein
LTGYALTNSSCREASFARFARDRAACPWCDKFQPLLMLPIVPLLRTLWFGSCGIAHFANAKWQKIVPSSPDCIDVEISRSEVVETSMVQEPGQRDWIEARAVPFCDSTQSGNDVRTTSPRLRGELRLTLDILSHYSPVFTAPLAINSFRRRVQFFLDWSGWCLRELLFCSKQSSQFLPACNHVRTDKGGGGLSFGRTGELRLPDPKISSSPCSTMCS